LSGSPGIDHVEVEPFEVAHVPGGEARVASPRDPCDLNVPNLSRSARLRSAAIAPAATAADRSNA
jgi:hypothetical protein